LVFQVGIFSDHKRVVTSFLHVVLENIEAEFVPPSFEEGFDKIYDFSNTASSYTAEEVLNILDAISKTPSSTQTPSRFFEWVTAVGLPLLLIIAVWSYRTRSRV
jgi:hypothetical protein